MNNTENPIAQAIITKVEKLIEGIIYFYGEGLNLPAYIRIETGTNRMCTIITVTDAINDWHRLHNGEKRDPFMTRGELFTYRLNPYNLCNQMHGEDSNYMQILNTLPAYTGLIAIDYKTEELREMFEPIVFTLDPL